MSNPLVPHNSSQDNLPKVANKMGRPKGSHNRKNSSKVEARLFGKWHIHPADKLVEIANALYLTADPDNMLAAAKIWNDLLKYFEPTKKPVESAPEKTTAEASKMAAEETFKLLQELENGTPLSDKALPTVQNKPAIPDVRQESIG